MNIHINYKIAVMAVFLAFTCFLASLGVAVAFEPETVISGVSVLDCDLSGLNRAAGEDRLLRLEKEIIQATPLVLRYRDRIWRLQPANIGLVIDREKVMDEAVRVGRRGSILRRWGEWKRAWNEGVQVPVFVKMDEARLENELKSIAAEVTVPPRDAYLKINPYETVEVVPSQDGMAVDIEKVYRDVQEVFRKQEATPEIKLALVKAGPRKTTQDVLDMGVNALLASYTTTFDAGDAGRSYNIGVAAGALDGVLIPPGETFSFNEMVGPRSSEYGYMNAKVIINNEFVDGLGGGVCQVSSTLYNTVLLANLEILERSSHSLPVFYVPPGRDATVTFEHIDFRFRNSSPRYIYLKTLVKPGRITVKIYGNSNSRREVTIRTRVVETIPFKETYQEDPSLMQGETRTKRQGISGMRVTAERVVLDNGIYKVENLPASFYRPVDQIILAGPGAGAPGSPPAAGIEANRPPGPAGPGDVTTGPASSGHAVSGSAAGGVTGTGGAAGGPANVTSGGILPSAGSAKKENSP